MIPEIIKILEKEAIDHYVFKNYQNFLKEKCCPEYDIRIKYLQRSKATYILLKNGFRPFKGNVEHNSIEHYYGFDEAANKIVHLHIYWRMLTGESQYKNSIIHDDKVFDNLSVYHGVRVPNRFYATLIHDLRSKLKRQSLVSVIRTFLDRKDYIDEKGIIDLEFPIENDKNLLNSNLLYYKNDRNLVKFVIRYAILIKNILGKIRIIKRAKTVRGGGIVICFVGPDGSGKTSVLDRLRSRLDFCRVTKLHYGLPTGFIQFLVKKKSHFSVIGGAAEGDGSKSKKQSLIKKYYYIYLAYSRLVVMRRAYRKSIKGEIVLIDRSPNYTTHNVDHANIYPDIGYLANVEKFIYSLIPMPDLIFNLDPGLDEVLARNRERNKIGKETDAGIKLRYERFQNVDYGMPTVPVHFKSLDDNVSFVLAKLFSAL